MDKTKFLLFCAEGIRFLGIAYCFKRRRTFTSEEGFWDDPRVVPYTRRKKNKLRQVNIPSPPIYQANDLGDIFPNDTNYTEAFWNFLNRYTLKERHASSFAGILLRPNLHTTSWYLRLPRLLPICSDSVLQIHPISLFGWLEYHLFHNFTLRMMLWYLIEMPYHHRRPWSESTRSFALLV